MGPYDEEKGRCLDHGDVEEACLNGELVPSSLMKGRYLDGDGREYDEEYNPIF